MLCRNPQTMLSKGRTMTHNSIRRTLPIEPDFDDFDPLIGPDEEEPDSSAFLPLPSNVEKPALAKSSEDSARSPEERLSNLLEAMTPRRRVLMGILSHCLEPQASSAVEAKVGEMQKHDFSVFRSPSLCALLEQAGALQRVDVDGTPICTDEANPTTVVVDGVEYLEVRKPPETFWLTTTPGQAALESDRPLERLKSLFNMDDKYLPIYKRILTLCMGDDGASTPSINDAVDHDPLVQKPRLYAPHFIDKLEQCDALLWKGSWHTTEVGRRGLEERATLETNQTPSLVGPTSPANE